MGITAECAEYPEESNLLARARTGEAQAFCQLASSHDQRLFRQACGLCGNISTAEDLVCETLAEAWRSFDRYNGTCRFSTWLFAILLHRHQKELRRARSRPVPLSALPPPCADDHLQVQQNLPAATASPAEAAMRKETAEYLRTAIAGLPGKHQQVLLLRFFQDSSLPEIAAVLHCSIGTVKSRLHYALEKLRRSQVDLNLSELRGDT
jgi:RNA polymerase sigma-70 factor (ECF subfamily)